MNRRDSLLALLVMVLWGCNFLALQWGLEDVPPLLFLTIRFVLVPLPILLLLLPRLGGWRAVLAPPKAAWWKIVLIGLSINVCQFGFLYGAMHAGLPPGLASLVHQSCAFMTIALAALFLAERLTPIRVGGVALGAAGLLIVIIGRGGHIELGPLLICLCGSFSWAVGNTLARATKVPGGFSLVIWTALVAPVPAFLLSLIIEGPSDIAHGLSSFGLKAALSTLYTVVLSSWVGYGVWYVLLHRNPSSQVAPWLLLIPPVGIVASWIAFNERPNLAEVIGGCVLIVGVLIAQGVFGLRRTPARVTAPAVPTD